MQEYLYVAHDFGREVLLGGLISDREFDKCSFSGCDFSQTEFRDCIFTDCTFTDCNLSMCLLTGSTVHNASFNRCKLLGIRFDHCNPILFSPRFEHSGLDYSWFTNLKMPRTMFTGCSLKSVNFSGCDLHDSDFADADLQGAIFDGTDLSGADMASASGFVIDPENNRLAKARFSLNNLDGLLARYEIKIT